MRLNLTKLHYIMDFCYFLLTW